MAGLLTASHNIMKLPAGIMRPTLRRIAAVVIALASGVVIASAQSSYTFVPVTDVMLQNPAPRD